MLTEATPGALEAQVASKVRSWVVASEKVPLAANCVLRPVETDGLAGVIVTVVMVAELTVNEKVVDTLPTVAVRIAVPGVSPLTRFGLP